MYKVTDNLQQLEQINEFAATQPFTDKYSKIIKHCKIDLYAMFFDETLIKYNLPFITEEWLKTDIFSNVPISWSWHRTDKPVRLIMTNQFVTDILLEQNALAEIITSKLLLNKEEYPIGDFIVKNEDKTIAYFNKVADEDISVISEYVISGNIEIETLQ